MLGSNAAAEAAGGLHGAGTGDEELDAALRIGSANAVVRARVLKRVRDYFTRFSASSPVSNSRARRVIAVSEVVKELVQPRLRGVDVGCVE